ncbi:MAG TPA: ParA family protein [Desulfuromonadales bacterium]|nr:ParA family protein [Desulfuromonadales bacterium]
MSMPYIVTISSEKGGVGKTTLATNLAIYLKALDENVPVTLCSFDNHFSVDRMFRIGRRPSSSSGDVASLLTGQPLREIVETGEYGVQFIPSNRELSELRERVAGPDVLAHILSQGDLSGILIIDTRPDLDIFTQNALYAADRVIIPVKDTPSLENCRNIYAFFDENRLSRRPLRVLPCLIDQRIRYEGPFKDPYQLLKAYAINRGYRCMEGYVAKSPKVESLNTNPEGKIYPILTHGRGTETHVQFTHLARQIYLGYREADGRRLDAVRAEYHVRASARSAAFDERRRRLQPDCLICGASLVTQTQIHSAAYYAETRDGRVCGFLEERCFSETVFRYFYQAQQEMGADDPLRSLFREATQHSYFVLGRAPMSDAFFQQQLAFYRFDDDGLEVSRKLVDLSDLKDAGGQASLSPLLSNILLDPQGRLTENFLLIRRVGSDFPEEILYDEGYDAFRRAAGKVAAQQH